MFAVIRKDHAPALGNVRELGRGDTIVIVNGASVRPDWARYLDAIGQAVTNGADVRQVKRGQTLTAVAPKEAQA